MLKKQMTHPFLIEMARLEKTEWVLFLDKLSSGAGLFLFSEQ
jgi:hypothetical protein